MSTQARKPVRLSIAAAPYRKGRQLIWEAIREFRAFDLEALHQESKANRRTISTYLECLRAGGAISQTSPGRWTLDRDTGVEAPRFTRTGKPVTHGLARQQMWTSMRILKFFDARDIALASSSEAVPVRFTHARAYIGHLHAAGYLALTQPAGHSRAGGLAKYALIPLRVAGPRAPIIQGRKSVFDPNLGKVVTNHERPE